MLEELKKRVCWLNLELFRNGLVRWTSGNVSGRDPKTNLVVIKPSGVKYEELSPEKMVVINLKGEKIEGNLKPSVDTSTHLYLYRHRTHVFGIVHTHSNYATSFAILGKPIPVCLTSLADEFGGFIPVGGYAPIGGEEIGKEILKSIGKSSAILMKHHGVFTLGRSPEEAVKKAVMVEDAAKTVFLASLLGKPSEIPPGEVKRLHQRYREKYGQK